MSQGIPRELKAKTMVSVVSHRGDIAAVRPEAPEEPYHTNVAAVAATSVPCAIAASVDSRATASWEDRKSHFGAHALQR